MVGLVGFQPNVVLEPLSVFGGLVLFGGALL